jgi:RNA-directed DNA polymerase
MHGHEKSDPVIVARKPTNKAGRPAAEPVERRTGAEGNAGQQRTRRAQDRESVSQALERVRGAARQRKKERFTALFHHLSVPMLRTAFFALKRDAAPGSDGLTWRTYEANLDRRIEVLHEQVHRGRTGRSRHDGTTFRSRMAVSARLRSPRLRTRSSNGQRSRC